MNDGEALLGLSQKEREPFHSLHPKTRPAVAKSVQVIRDILHDESGLAGRKFLLLAQLVDLLAKEDAFEEDLLDFAGFC